MTEKHFYKAYGLTVGSYRRIPSLIPSCKPDSVDVSVQPATLERPSSHGSGHRSMAVHQDEIVVHWKNWVTLSMRKGRKILVDQVPNSDDRFTQLLIAGTGLGIILHQMEQVTLHASAVATDQGAVGFLGHKGMGKSTTAVGMMKRGYPLITDDVLVLQLSDGAVRTAPGERIFKLRPDAATTLIESGDEDLQSLYDHSSKKSGLISRQCTSKIPLHRIYVLDFDKKKDGSLPRVEPVSPSDAYMDITRNSYSLRFLDQSGLDEWYFNSIAEVVRNVPVYKVIRKRKEVEIEETLSFLEDHFDKK